MKVIDFPIGSYKEVESFKSTFRKKMISLLRSINVFAVDPCCQNCETAEFLSPIYPTGAYQYFEKTTTGDDVVEVDVNTYYTQIEWYDQDTGTLTLNLPEGIHCGQIKKIEFYRDETGEEALVTLVTGNFCGTEDTAFTLRGYYSYAELLWMGSCWKILALIENTDV